MDAKRVFLDTAGSVGFNNENRFKAGSLRNITLTAPYFHNGTVSTLPNVFLTFLVHSAPPPQDIPNLIAFLQTLTDQTTVSEVRFSDPF